MNKEEIEIRTYHKCSQIQTAIGTASMAEKMYPKLEKIIIHQDRDAGKHGKLSKSKLESIIDGDYGLKKTIIFETKFNDIEAYFINSTHIKHLYSDFSEYQIDEIINNATKSLEKNRLITLKKQSNSPEIIEDAYFSNVEKYRHGKKLKRKIQQELNSLSKGKVSHNITQYSDFITKDEQLQNIAKEIWGSKA